MMNSMMQQTLQIGTARKADLPGWPAAGKTGTSQDYRDAWFIGYTGHLVDHPASWLNGNDDSTPSQEGDRRRQPAGGDLGAGFMKTAHQWRAGGSSLPGGRQRAADREPVASSARAMAAKRPDRPAFRSRAIRRGRSQSASADNSLDNWFINRLFGRR